MECHLAAAKLKRDGRARAFNRSASSRFEHGLDSRPLDVSIDWVGQYLLKGLALRSVHGRMIAFATECAIIEVKGRPALPSRSPTCLERASCTFWPCSPRPRWRTFRSARRSPWGVRSHAPSLGTRSQAAQRGSAYLAGDRPNQSSGRACAVRVVRPGAATPVAQPDPPQHGTRPARAWCHAASGRLAQTSAGASRDCATSKRRLWQATASYARPAPEQPCPPPSKSCKPRS